MKKIFYHPVTLKIMGMSEGDNSMSFPFVETPKNYHSTQNLAIVMKEGKPTLKVKEGDFKKAYPHGIVRPRGLQKPQLLKLKKYIKSSKSTNQS